MEPEDSLPRTQEPATCPSADLEGIVSHIHKNSCSIELVTLCNPTRRER